MNHEQLAEGLKQLRLFATKRDYNAIALECENSKKTYENYLASIVANELREKDQLRIARFLKHSKLPLVKLIEEFDFSERTGINSQQVMRLCEGDFLKSAGNIVLYGTVGVGKSHLAMGIVRRLCERNFRCLFTSTQTLINELLAAHKTLSLASLLKRLDHFDLLAIDELGYLPQNQEGADLFFQLISQRYERKSILITTNLTYSEWDKIFLNPITTAAAIDRIIHNCETYNIQGPSWRRETARKRKLNTLDLNNELASL